MVIVILTSLISLAGIPKEPTSVIQFYPGYAIICGFEVNEEMICVVSVFSHLLQDLPHGEDLISG